MGGRDPTLGPCRYWSRTPGGIDTWDPGAAASDMTFLLALPACPPASAQPAGATTVAQRAWEVFRSWTLPRPELTFAPPDRGITGLPTFVSAATPVPLEHREAMPSGLELLVRAEVVAATVDWGDGTTTRHDPADLAAFPAGSATHTYSLKTCPPDYRVTHPSGGNCHPTLEAYPVTVTFSWTGRYRYDAGWIDLGVVDLATSVSWDVDEVVGVLEP